MEAGEVKTDIFTHNMNLSFESRFDNNRKKEDNNNLSRNMRDTAEISDEAYRLREKEGIHHAESGKDSLYISDGDKENELFIHFSDNAVVSRTISRGYITVDGTKIELLPEDKDKLADAGKKAEEKRVKAYMNYVAQHEAAVAKQQGEAIAQAIRDSGKSLLEKIIDDMEYSKDKKSDKGVSWADFKWDRYETVMSISDGIHIGEIKVQKNVDEY